MSKVRIIGIDFGTSTSALGFRDFTQGEDGKLTPISDIQLFGVVGRVIPTLVFEKTEEGVTSYSYADECPSMDSEDFQYVARNFKMQFLDEVRKGVSLMGSAEEFVKERDSIDAVRLTKRFFKYLYDSYCTINRTDKSILASSEYQVRTVITCPVRSSEVQKSALVAVASLAGFPNVTTLDEATTVMRYALGKANSPLRERLCQTPEGSRLKILVVDMGAGTTDMVLYDYCAATKFADSNLSELGCWPQIGTEKSLGGKEVDEVLLDYFSNAGFIEYQDREEALAAAKKAKEDYFSPELKRGATINRLSALSSYSEDAPKRFRKAEGEWLDRSKFDGIINGFAIGFIKAVKDLLAHAKERVGESDIDFVIISGGGSKWYFIDDIIVGHKQFDGLSLDMPKVAEGNGLISDPEPQLMDLYGILYPIDNVRLVPISWNAMKIRIEIFCLRIVKSGWDIRSSQLIKTFEKKLMGCHQVLPLDVDREEIPCESILVRSDHGVNVKVSLFANGKDADENAPGWVQIGTKEITSERSLARVWDNLWNGANERVCGVKLVKSVHMDCNRRMRLNVYFDIDGYWTYNLNLETK